MSEDYTLRTNKDINNIPTDLDIDIVDVFLSENNQNLLLRSINRILSNNSSKIIDLNKLSLLQDEYLMNTDITKFKMAYDPEQINWVELLKYINNHFIRQTYKLINWKPTVDKKITQPDDYRNLNVWAKKEINITNDRQYQSNKIPVWRRSLHMRSYDRDNEGLRYSNDNSSREEKIRGYNMSSIKKDFCNWESEKWFGF